ncbi:DUF3467 domain-containing protein [Candidatus Woesearchaeota archaeon]|nr:DUF3467 domain-containing protein [Candidatus Woesearchaeota archaeon]
MSEEKKLNMSISEGDEFFAHELSINFNPMQFTFDFKCVTPRVDARSKEAPTIVAKHNVVMTDPYHAKQILSLLKNVIENYEEQYGKIEKPSAMKEFEKKQKKKGKEPKNKTRTPSYFG